MGLGGQHHAPAALPPRSIRYPLYRRLGGPQGWSGLVRKISPPTGIRSPGRPSHSESLYRLIYPGPRGTHLLDPKRRLRDADCLKGFSSISLGPFAEVPGSFEELSRVRLSVCINSASTRMNDVSLDIGALYETPLEKLQVPFKSDKNFGHSIWRPEYIYIVDSCTKYFVSWRQCKGNALLPFNGKIQRVCVVVSDICS